MWRLPRDKEKGFTTRNIRKEGPTNCIVTTTALNLHGENETRMLSLSTNDSASQTQAIMRQLAAGSAQDSPDLTEWHNLQIWLAGAERRVVIPYAGFLANNIPPIAVRLRRDFRAILRLIETHAMLHQLTRGRDESGRVVAEVADYAAIRDLVADLVSEGVGSMVPDSVRETVKIVEEIAGSDGARIDAVAARLKIERSAAGRRLGTARARLHRQPGGKARPPRTLRARSAAAGKARPTAARRGRACTPDTRHTTLCTTQPTGLQR